ncbi:MAG: 2-dehydro-3-deoxy-D-gluconate 5-dehydrogenase KduD [Mycoplasmatales bacterium]
MSLTIKDFQLDGQVAIVTGGNTGLGLAYSEALANLGANIMVVGYIDDFKEVEEVVTKAGSEFYGYVADLTKQEEIQQVIPKCIEKFGKVDILVNNAGMIKRNPLLEFPKKDWDDVININLNTVFFLSQEAAKVMKEQGSGKIINIASMLSFQGGVFVPSYTASKHGVAGITKAFANELAQYNIQINAIAPGYIKTANTAPIRADEKRNAEILSRIPAGYWADPEHIAGGVAFLATSASDYVNGVVIPVDGGWQAR